MEKERKKRDKTEKSHSMVNESKWVEDKEGLINEVVNWGIRETILKL